MAADRSLRGWLLAEVPRSKWQARSQRFYIGWLEFRRNPIAMIGLAIILGLIFVAAFAPWITASDGLEPELANRLQAPSAEHWFGTDQLGRDIFDRIIWGSRITLYIVGLVTIIVVPI
jgi:peptide/nickel transport system permease protein